MIELVPIALSFLIYAIGLPLFMKIYYRANPPIDLARENMYLFVAGSGILTVSGFMAGTTAFVLNMSTFETYNVLGAASGLTLLASTSLLILFNPQPKTPRRGYRASFFLGLWVGVGALIAVNLLVAAEYVLKLAI